MANIPREVIELHILPRLPVKSLLRFKSVSKSWQTLISSPDFIRLHRHHAHSSDKNRFLAMLGKPSDTLHLHKLDSPVLAPPLLLSYPKPMLMDIVASCEFLLLLTCDSYYNTRGFGIDWLSPQIPEKFYELVLLNPSTGSYHEIPVPSRQIKYKYRPTIYGLYFDETNHDYKVATIYQNHACPPTKWEVMVYSSKTNSWTLIEQKLDKFYGMLHGVVAVIGHLLHTILLYSNNYNKTTRIGCFDIMAEQWTNDIALPDNFAVDNLICDSLCVFDGLLCGGMEDAHCRFTGNYQVWVMKEYGVKESWVKLLNIDTNNFRFSYRYLPVAYSEGSRHEILCQKPFNGKLFWYNMTNKKVEKVEFYGCRASISGLIICKESLVNFVSGRQINLRQSEIKEMNKWKKKKKAKKVETNFIYQLLDSIPKIF